MNAVHDVDSVAGGPSFCISSSVHAVGSAATGAADGFSAPVCADDSAASEAADVFSAPATPEPRNSPTGLSPAKGRRFRGCAATRGLWRRTRWHALASDAGGNDCEEGGRHRDKRPRLALCMEVAVQTATLGYVQPTADVEKYFTESVREIRKAVTAELGKVRDEEFKVHEGEVKKLRDEIDDLRMHCVAGEEELAGVVEVDLRSEDRGPCNRCDSLELLLSGEEPVGGDRLLRRLVVVERDLAWACRKLQEVAGIAGLDAVTGVDLCVGCGGILDDAFAASEKGDFLVIQPDHLVPSVTPGWTCGECSGYNQQLDDEGRANGQLFRHLVDGCS